METTRGVDQFLETLKAARSVSTPLIAIRTTDPALSTARIQATVGKSAPVLQWDVVRGLYHLNRAGEPELRKMLGEREAGGVGPADALVLAERLGEDGVLIFSNAQRFWNDPTVAQGIWNLRDSFKAEGRTLVLFTTPGAILPDELTQDVLILDEPLPAIEDLSQILEETITAAGMGDVTPGERAKAVDALLGLAAFSAEQVLALSLARKKLDLDQVWERKRQVIEQRRGMNVWRGGETFDDIGGCENIKRFLCAVINGAEPPRGIVFVDEIEKAFAGAGTDLSGVKTELTGTILTWLQDRGADGVLFIGPPGAAKSAVAKAAGNTAGVPTIAFDLAAMQGSLVGESGDNLRAALKVVDAVTNGRSLWIATCNSIGTLPPELRRRFTLGTFFFDLPSPEERAAIWRIYLAKYGVSGDIPDDEGWTGAEIKECCRKAHRLKISLAESAQYIVPVSRSAAEQIKTLRSQASGRFISASHPGIYEFQESAPAPRTGRAFRGMGA
jgi:hypothetical protein